MSRMKENKHPIALFNQPECSRSPSHSTSGLSVLHFNFAYLQQLPSFHSFAQPSHFTANRLPGCLCLSGFSLSYISIDSFPRHVLSPLPVVNDAAATPGSAPFPSLSFTANLLLLPFALMIAIIFLVTLWRVCAHARNYVSEARMDTTRNWHTRRP